QVAGGPDVSRALSSLLKNAFEAGRTGPVSLRVYWYDALWRFEIHDRGPEMSAEVSRRIGEPFFTTKPPGEGLGLGVFLARTVMEQHGGSLRFESNNGTTAILELPSGAAS
ncbi:MAG: ATP-binding protein, partial [Acidimicrobiia bacterium]